MQIVSISKRRLRTLPHIELSKNTFNTEGTLYYLELKNKWETIPYALKKYYEITGERFSNKLYTINQLIDSKDIINMVELVMPESLVSIEGQIQGFIMPYIDHVNFNDLLEDPNCSRDIKIDYFKQIGEILKKLKYVRRYTTVKDIYINDLHESNFIIDKDGQIKVVDMDSCKIGNNAPFPSRYLAPCNYIYDVPKYRKTRKYKNYNEFDCPYKINETTDLYCYTIMILNYLYGGKITHLSLSEYYNYLEYLKMVGVDKNLIDIFDNLYTKAPNKNPLEYLDSLKKLDGRTRGSVYRKVR